MRDTDYARELVTAEHEGARIERLFVKEDGQEEIRFSWWKDGRMAPRPLDIPEPDLLTLMRSAIQGGAFGADFLDGLEAALAERP